MSKRNTNFEAMEKYFWENYQGEYDVLKHACEDILQESIPIMDYPRNMQDFPNMGDRLGDHFRGLPYPFYPTPYYHEIEENLREWGIIKEGYLPSRVNKMKEDWWSYWAGWVIKNAEGKRL